jgi:hypothetical protein
VTTPGNASAWLVSICVMRVRVRTAQRLHEQHGGLRHVLRVLSEPGHVGEAADAEVWLADYLERTLGDWPRRQRLGLCEHRQLVGKAIHDRRKQVGVLGRRDAPLGRSDDRDPVGVAQVRRVVQIERDPKRVNPLNCHVSGPPQPYSADENVLRQAQDDLSTAPFACFASSG